MLDSSFLVAFHNARDVHHRAAATAMEPLLEGAWGEILLPEHVFLEVVTVLAARRSLAAAVEVGDLLLSARELEFVPCSDAFRESWSLFRDQREGKLSFADAAIVAVARRRGASHVATFDRDFEDLAGLALVP